MKYLKNYFKKTLLLLKGYLVDGFSPEKFSLAIVLGACFGTIPFIGLNTLILTLVALALRLNIAIIQVFNYAVYPIQIVLYIPFLKLGSHISGNPNLTLSFQDIRAIFKEDFWQAILNLGEVHAWGILVWAVIITPIAFLLYFIFSRMLVDYKNGKKNLVIRTISNWTKKTNFNNI